TNQMHPMQSVNLIVSYKKSVRQSIILQAIRKLSIFCLTTAIGSARRGINLVYGYKFRPVMAGTR
ncbi:MAG: hypothetical protein JXI43_11165, partial [Tissierellales bacterium]|nr:hypothetical protein [Tissierellales bacterium]